MRPVLKRCIKQVTPKRAKRQGMHPVERPMQFMPFFFRQGGITGDTLAQGREHVGAFHRDLHIFRPDKELAARIGNGAFALHAKSLRRGGHAAGTETLQFEVEQVARIFLFIRAIGDLQCDRPTRRLHGQQHFNLQITINHALNSSGHHVITVDMGLMTPYCNPACMAGATVPAVFVAPRPLSLI